MADKKISQLTEISSATPTDQLIINDDNNTTKRMAYANLMGASHREGSYTTFVGHYAGQLNTGDTNTGVGYMALRYAEPDPNIESGYGNRNSALGYRALNVNTSGWCGTAVGAYALYSNTTGQTNTAVGSYSLYTNISGDYNVAVGSSSLRYNITGSANTAVGRYSLRNNETGFANVGIGKDTGYMSQGSRSIFVGFQTGFWCDGAYQDVSIGNATGYCSGQKHSIGNDPSMVAGRQHIIIDVGTTTDWRGYGWGNRAWVDNTTYNSAGWIVSYEGTDYRSLTHVGLNKVPSAHLGTFWEVATVPQDYDVFTSNSNTGDGDGIVALFGTLNTSVGSVAFNKNHTTDISRHLYFNTTSLGYNAEPDGSNQVVLGDGNADTYVKSGTVQSISDERDKADIEDTALGLDFISALTPRQFRWDSRSDYYEITYTEEEQVTTETDPETGEETTTTETIYVDNKVSTPRDGSKKRTRLHQGLIAQEVKQVMDDMGIDFAGYQDHTVNGGADQLTLGYSELIAPMIKAIQELKARIVVLEGA